MSSQTSIPSISACQTIAKSVQEAPERSRRIFGREDEAQRLRSQRRLCVLELEEVASVDAHSSGAFGGARDVGS